MNDGRDMKPTPEERRIADEIRGLGGVRPAAEFRSRLRADFVQGRLAPSVSQVRPAPKVGVRRLVWVALPTALAAGLALTMLMTGGGPTWTLREASGSGSIAVGEQAVAAGDEGQLRALIGPGARVAAGPDAELDVICGDIAVLGLAAGAEAVLPSDPGDPGDPWEVVVITGEVSVLTGPGFEGRRLVLTTDGSRTEIVGTAVAVFACAELTCVCVMEGTAQVGADAAHMDPIPAGMRKVVFNDDRAPLIVEIEPDHARNLRAFMTRNDGAFR